MANLTIPPWVQVPGVNNFRDLGGYSTSNSSPTHSIRRNYVYRCGEPSRVTDAGITTLQNLGIAQVYDLRSKNEIEKQKVAGIGGVREWGGCERIFAPVFLEEDYSPENLAIRFKNYASNGTEGFAKAYENILENAPPSYRQILLHLANSPDKPLIIHCTAGKDRTGVICALILSICGVPDETIAYEYSLTQIGLAEFRAVLTEHLMQMPALEGSQQGALNMLSSRAENMMATLKMLREKFGSAEHYVIEKCGLKPEDVQNIRKNLIVDETPLYIDIPKI